MISEIVKKDNDILIINWSKEGIGFGQLTIKWNPEIGYFQMDTECMGIDFALEVIQALK